MHIRNYRKIFDGNVEQFGKVGVLYGGTSAEREISLKSGRAVLDALLEKGVDAVGVDCGENVVSQIMEANIDTAWVVLHGVGGEDGKVQAVLDSLNIPYTGSDHAASALGMDKLKTKYVWQSVGVPTPQFYKLSDDSDWESIISHLGGAAFVKPTREGSSIGMSVAKTAEELKSSYELAAQFDSQVIAEARVVGAEYSISILNGNVLPIVEVRAAKDFYDYEAKYESNLTQYLSADSLDVRKEQQLKAAALEAFLSVGCKGWGRVDVMLNKLGQPFFLEVNTVPGMTSHSLVPMAAMQVGLEFADLVLEILMQTVKK